MRSAAILLQGFSVVPQADGLVPGARHDRGGVQELTARHKASMPSEESHATGRVQVPHSEAVVRTRRQHKVSLLVVLNMSNRVGVALVCALTLKQKRFEWSLGVEINQRHLGVLATHKEGIALTAAHRSAAVYSAGVGSLSRSEFVVLNDELLRGDVSDVKHTVQGGRDDVLLIVGEIARDNDRFRFLVFEEWSGRLASIVEANQLV